MTPAEFLAEAQRVEVSLWLALEQHRDVHFCEDGCFLRGVIRDAWLDAEEFVQALRWLLEGKVPQVLQCHRWSEDFPELGRVADASCAPCRVQVPA